VVIDRRYDKIGKIGKGGNTEEFVHGKLSRQYPSLKKKLTILGKQYDDVIHHVNSNMWNNNKGGK
jgi:hypothetical protein